MYTGVDFINKIKEFYPKAKSASGNTEIVIRCPFCGDSKNLSHAHLYISVPKNQEDLSFYNCKKCNARGILNEEFLRKIDCADINFLVDVTKNNSKILALPKYKSLKQIDIYPLNMNFIREDKFNLAKLKYINDRIGANFKFSDLPSLKIFLNLYDIIYPNKLELTRYESIVNDLDKWFIGFISYDNSFCGLRKLTERELYKSINKRYINYSLINKLTNNKNFYVIPSQIDITNPTPVRIHIAEGQFDILSIYYNLNNCNRNQNIYIACGGKSYTQALEFILLESGIINYEIHFYPDKDVNDYTFSNIINNLKLLPTNMYIHRNIYAGEKDYGVPKNRIKESISIIYETPIF